MKRNLANLNRQHVERLVKASAHDRSAAIEALKRAGWSPRQINHVIKSGRIYSPFPRPPARDVNREIELIVRRLIVELAGLGWNVSFAQLTGKDMIRQIAAPRGAAMWLVREILGEQAPFPAIGRWFGRDHSTVMHAVHIAKWRDIADDRLGKAVSAVLAAMTKRQKS